MLLYKKIHMQFIFFIFLILSLNNISNADVGNETGLDIPRFISLKSDDANIRIGPSKNYPIVLKYIIKSYPLKVIDEYKEWRKIEDFQNNTGWIHKSLISGKRTGLILSHNNKEIEVLNTVDGQVIGLIGEGNIVFINKCKINWCFISLKNYKGWVNKISIWGVKDNEIYKIGYAQIIEDIYWKSVNFIQKIKMKI